MDNSGILIVNKAEGYSSHDCVNILRSKTGIKKIGHGGTLDPLATGVLPIFIGKATKSIEFLDCDLKRYRAVCKLGIRTNTDDILGDILENKNIPEIDFEKVNEILQSFKGRSIQIAPKHSALKYKGKPLYKYARAGEEVPDKKREIYVQNIVLHGINTDEIDFEVITSKGTYIRKLCNDIAERIGTLGTMKSLVRLDSGRFGIDESYSIEKIKDLKKEEIFNIMLPVDYPLMYLPKIFLTEEEKEHFIHGRKFKVTSDSVEDIKCFEMINTEKVSNTQQLHRIYCDEKFLGIASIDEFKNLKVEKVY